MQNGIHSIGCSLILKKLIVNARIEDHGSADLTSIFALFVFLLCRLTSGAFTIDSSTLTLRINLNEHLIESRCNFRKCYTIIIILLI
jgi:hypothetical protein